MPRSLIKERARSLNAAIAYLFVLGAGIVRWHADLFSVVSMPPLSAYAQILV
jgi:hypothetical protein